MNTNTNVSCPVTALKFIPWSNSILIGNGGVAILFRLSTASLHDETNVERKQYIQKYRVFDRAAIHGFRFNTELSNDKYAKAVLAFGGKGLKVYSSENFDTILFDASEVRDWIMDAAFTRFKGIYNAVVTVSAHNDVEIFNMEGNSPLVISSLLHISSPVKCLLYSASIHHITDRSHKFKGETVENTTVEVAAGTIFSEVLVWSPLQENASIFNSIDGDGGSEDATSKISCQHLVGHSACIFRVAWSRDGKYLGSASDDRTVTLWQQDVESDNKNNTNKKKWKSLWTSYGHRSRLWDICFTENNKLLLSTSEDATCRVWSVSTGECLSVLNGHTGKHVWRVDVSSCGKYAFTGGNDGSVKMWKLDDHIKLKENSLKKRICDGERIPNTLANPKDVIRCMTMNENGSKIFAATQNGYIWMFNNDDECDGNASDFAPTDDASVKTKWEMMCFTGGTSDGVNPGDRCICSIDVKDDELVFGRANGFISIIHLSNNSKKVNDDYVSSTDARSIYVSGRPLNSQLLQTWKASTSKSRITHSILQRDSENQIFCITAGVNCGIIFWNLSPNEAGNVLPIKEFSFESNKTVTNTSNNNDNKNDDNNNDYTNSFISTGSTSKSTGQIGLKTGMRGRGRKQKKRCITAIMFSASESLLLAGDSKGAVYVWRTSDPSSGETSSEGSSPNNIPDVIIPSAHGNQSVTKFRMHPNNSNLVYSSGHDGKINQYSIHLRSFKEEKSVTCNNNSNSNNKPMLHLDATFNTGPLSAVENFWWTLSPVPPLMNDQYCQDDIAIEPLSLIATGFRENDFIVYDLHSNYNCLRYTCGGWKRPWCATGMNVTSSHPATGFSCAFVTGDDKSQIRVESVGDKGTSIIRNSNDILFRNPVILQGNHGQIINSVKLRPIALTQSSRPTPIFIATGSEDTTVKLFMRSFHRNNVENNDVDINDMVSNVKVENEKMSRGVASHTSSVALCSIITKHTSSVQVVAWSNTFEENDDPILITAGAKQQLHVWKVKLDEYYQRASTSISCDDEEIRCNVNVCHLGGYHPSLQNKQSNNIKKNIKKNKFGTTKEAISNVTQRYISLTSFPVRVCWGSGLSHIIVAGDSEGVCSIFKVDVPPHGERDVEYYGRNNVALLAQFHGSKRPILSISGIHTQRDGDYNSRDIYVVSCGLTDGSLNLWDLSPFIMEYCRGTFNNESIEMPIDSHYVQENNLIKIIFDIKLHDMGVNSLSMKWIQKGPINDGSGGTSVLDSSCVVVVTGGDDQQVGITCIDFQCLDYTESPFIKMHAYMSEIVKEISASTIKSLYTDGRYVIFSGFDQRLDIWKLTEHNILDEKKDATKLSKTLCDRIISSSRKETQLIQFVRSEMLDISVIESLDCLRVQGDSESDLMSVTVAGAGIQSIDFNTSDLI